MQLVLVSLNNSGDRTFKMPKNVEYMDTYRHAKYDARSLVVRRSLDEEATSADTGAKEPNAY